MANMPSGSSPRPVSLDDKTKSIMDREIAREQIAPAYRIAFIRHNSRLPGENTMVGSVSL